MLKPIRPKRISDQVFDQLKDLIFRGHRKPGEQLMSERELAQSLNVSRPTVREAINKLVAAHLLEHRQGQGTFVNLPSASAEKNPLAAVINGYDVPSGRMPPPAAALMERWSQNGPNPVSRLFSFTNARERFPGRPPEGPDRPVAFVRQPWK